MEGKRGGGEEGSTQLPALPFFSHSHFGLPPAGLSFLLPLPAAAGVRTRLLSHRRHGSAFPGARLSSCTHRGPARATHGVSSPNPSKSTRNLKSRAERPAAPSSPARQAMVLRGPGAAARTAAAPPERRGGESYGPRELLPVWGKAGTSQLRSAAAGRIAAYPAAQGRAAAAAPRWAASVPGGAFPEPPFPRAAPAAGAGRDVPAPRWRSWCRQRRKTRAGSGRRFLCPRRAVGSPPPPPRPRGRGTLRALPELSQHRGPDGRSRAGPIAGKAALPWPEAQARSRARLPWGKVSRTVASSPARVPVCHRLPESSRFVSRPDARPAWDGERALDLLAHPRGAQPVLVYSPLRGGCCTSPEAGHKGCPLPRWSGAMQGYPVASAPVDTVTRHPALPLLLPRGT